MMRTFRGIPLDMLLDKRVKQSGSTYLLHIYRTGEGTYCGYDEAKVKKQLTWLITISENSDREICTRCTLGYNRARSDDGVDLPVTRADGISFDTRSRQDLTAFDKLSRRNGIRPAPAPPPTRDHAPRRDRELNREDFQLAWPDPEVEQEDDDRKTDFNLEDLF
jgi:hypothetical protein